MVLVLCDPCDTAALWAARELEARGVDVDVVTGPVLESALRWEHRVGDDGASFAIDLFDGRRVVSDTRVAVLNRLSFVPTDRLRRMLRAEDLEYATQEFHALFLSWLHAVPGPVVNRPSPQGLGGHWRHPLRWAALAAQAGLPTPCYKQGSDDGQTQPASNQRGPVVTVFAIGERVVAPPFVPEEVATATDRLARLAGDTLLGVELAAPPAGRWEVVGVTAMPYLPLGGSRLVDALIEVLKA